MPEELLCSGSKFDRSKAALGHWLRTHTVSVRALMAEDIVTYKDHSFVSGWAIEIENQGEIIALDVLIDGQYPYSPIRIALTSKDVYLKWPHVEFGGVLCLPRIPPPAAGLSDAIAVTISNAIMLIDNCMNPAYVRDEFRQEFIAYWDRNNDKGKPVRSLLNLSDRQPRTTAVWFGQAFTLVGETPGQLGAWFKNLGKSDKLNIVTGIYGFLDEAPAPPFPDCPRDLFKLLAKHCPDALALFHGLQVDKVVAIVLGAESSTGVGLIAANITCPTLKGFRKGNAVTQATKMTLWKSRSELQRRRVKRFDAAWVHSRSLNKQQPRLEQSTVLLLGCGSLGSQVAVRLAQSGVGSILLVDPQDIQAANVGRHVLGINSVGRSKVSELAHTLRLRFPHMREVEGYPETWQALYERDPGIFECASLIVACLGEWGADGQLGEWHVRTGCDETIVYGWLDERGTAAHALALAGRTPALSCILRDDGNLRMPETLWDGDGLVQAEPACGTLFQPYGAIDVALAEALLTRLCINLLTGNVTTPTHLVHAGSTAQIVEAGGAWSPEHLKFRPKGFDGAFEYERPVATCGVCSICRGDI